MSEPEAPAKAGLSTLPVVWNTAARLDLQVGKSFFRSFCPGSWGKMMSEKARLAALVLLAFLLLAGCEATVERYFAYVDKVEPAIPGLDVKGTRGIGGEISIVNGTGMDVYIYENGQEVLKITPTASFIKYPPGTWSFSHNGHTAGYSSSVIEYWGSPQGRYRGQVMKTWVIEGRAGDTPFKIYGRTVYEPGEWGQ